MNLRHESQLPIHPRCLRLKSTLGAGTLCQGLGQHQGGVVSTLKRQLVGNLHSELYVGADEVREKGKG